MPSRPSPSSSVQAARRELADRLHDLMKDAGLTGRALAEQAGPGWGASKVSRILHGIQPPSDEDIRTWCRVCGASEQAPDLIASSRTTASMYREWRRLHRTGMRRLQVELAPLYVRARHMRTYSSSFVPGLLQTPGYATAVMNTITAFQGTPDDVDAAVAARMNRSQVIKEPGHTFAIVLEETVLRRPFGDVRTMVAQLGYLVEAMTLPSVSLGIIPFGAVRDPMWPLETFDLFGEEQAIVELLGALVTVTSPSEIALYGKAFEKLHGMAVYGPSARRLITAALDSLDG